MSRKRPSAAIAVSEVGGVLRPRLLTFLAVVAAACDSNRGETGPSTTDDSGSTVCDPCGGDTGTEETGLPKEEDVDRDGYAVADGDCDDTDPSISPGAEEVVGDVVDDDCNGTLYATTAVSDLAAPLAGRADFMTFGEVITLATGASDRPAALLVSQTGAAKGEYGARGEVQVFSPAAAFDGSGAETILTYSVDEGTFGQYNGVIDLYGGERAWGGSFSRLTRYGGLCAWDSSRTGTLDVEEADACVPHLEHDTQNRVQGHMTSMVDLDGDGFDDLASGGSAAPADGSESGMVASIWLFSGPLSYESVAGTPEVAIRLTDNNWTPNAVVGPGDLTGDGYSDLVVVCDEADTDTALSAGSLWVVPGATGTPETVALLDGIDADRDDGGLRAMAAPDLDGDGSLDLCVGAPLDSTVGERAGRVGCFYGPVSGRQGMSAADHELLAEGAYSWFGYSLAAVDIDGDGDDELAVGDPDDFYYGAGWPGRVYLFDPPSGSDPVEVIVGERWDGLGRVVQAGDLDGDGRDDLAIGAPWANTMRGQAWVISGALLK